MYRYVHTGYRYLYYIKILCIQYCTWYIWFEIIFTFSSAELFPMHVLLNLYSIHVFTVHVTVICNVSRS